MAETQPYEFALILIDINLPGIDGLSLLKVLKSKAILATTPVFVLTSSESQTDISSAYQHGADGYLVKPYDAAGYASLAAFLVDIWNGGTNPIYPGLRIPQKR